MIIFFVNILPTSAPRKDIGLVMSLTTIISTFNFLISEKNLMGFGKFLELLISFFLKKKFINFDSLQGSYNTGSIIE